MPLSPRKALAAAAVLKLAGDAVPPPSPLPGAGQTIAQQAGAAGAHAGGGHGGARKVATAQGSAHFKAPIGSLIIPHEHFIAGQPSHFSPYISQAKWLANQWKSKPDADDAAHKAVEAGTHRWVQAGDHEFAVHKGLEVHVPKSVDVHNPASVQKAPKVIVKRGDHPENVTFGANFAQGITTPHDASSESALKQHYKPLHLPEKPHKSVSFEGKHAAWVPHDWQVYKVPTSNEGGLAGKWAKDPEGNWHIVHKDGSITKEHAGTHSAPDWVKHGQLVPDDSHADEHPIPPHQEGPQPGKLDVGGVAVTKEQIQHAIELLTHDKSTAVKQPLAKAGHPLAGMDYHGVSKAELAKHPELKVSPGSKKAHVGQVKLAVIHHLGKQLQRLSGDQADEHVAQHAVDHVQAEADHIRELTPHTTELPKEPEAKPPFEGTPTKLYYDSSKGPDSWPKYEMVGNKYPFKWNAVYEDGSKAGLGPSGQGHLPGILSPVDAPAPEKVKEEGPGEEPAVGADSIEVPAHPDSGVTGSITASQHDVQEAVNALTQAKSTAIKQVLKAKGSKLASVDYWAVIHAYEKAHPNTAKGKGTKQAHVGNAKALFIAALQEKLAGLKKADQATGHDRSAELYALAKNGTLKPDPGQGQNLPWAISKAAVVAVKTGEPYYIYKNYSGQWVHSVVIPSPGTAYYRVSPQLKLMAHLTGQEGQPAQVLLWNALHMWVEPKGEEPPGEVHPSLLEKLPPLEEKPQPIEKVLADAKQAKEWKKDPLWEAIHSQITHLHSNPKEFHSLSEGREDIKKQMTTQLVVAYVFDEPKYLVNVSDTGFKPVSNPPLPGSYAANETTWWEMRPDHQVILHQKDGTEIQMPAESVHDIIKQGTKKPEQLPKHKGVTVTAGEHTWHGPEGTAVYKTGPSIYYARPPDGKWVVVDKYSGVEHPAAGNYATLAEYAKKAGTPGYWTPVNDAAKQFSADAGLSDLKEKLTGEVPDKPPPDVKVYINGALAQTFPAGTKVYVSTVKKESQSVKFAKDPDGNWWYVHPAPKGKVAADPGNNWDENVANYAGYMEEPHEPNGMPSPPKPAEAENQILDSPPVKEMAGIPAIYQGEIKGEWPSGAQFYYKNVGSYGGLYARTDDGKWWRVTPQGVSEAPSYMANDKMLSEQHTMEKQEPPTAADIQNAKDVTEVKALLKAGTVDPQKGLEPGKSVNQSYKTWQQAMVAHIANNKKFGSYEGDVTVTHAANGNGFNTLGGHQPGAEHWQIKGSDMSITHYPAGGGSPEPVPMAQLKEAAARYVVPDSVIIAGKQYKFGFYKKPKGTAVLEIKKQNGWVKGAWKYGTGVHASYVYHNADGSTSEKTATFAENFLKGTEHFADKPEPKPKAEKPLGLSVTHAKVMAPGTWKLWSGTDSGPNTVTDLVLNPDGSAIYQGTGGATSAVHDKTVGLLVKSGTVLDQHGTTVVKPGVTPDSIHIWGGPAKTMEEVKFAKEAMKAHWSQNWQDFVTPLLFPNQGESQSMKDFKHLDLAKAYMAEHGAVSGEQMQQAAYDLLNELTGVPGLPEGAQVSTEPAAPKQVTFLKSLPPGVKKAEDIFTFTATGWAHPFAGDIPANPSTMTVPEAKALIAKISQQYGDGKVVGTHLSLPKYSLTDWLDSWRKGDMQAVFEIDASGGKVSPAHPGAPDNTGTHHITWSPHDPGQVPASQDIPGEWTKLEYGSIPPAEVNNYLVKLNFKHAEFLQDWQRHAIVIAHRQHDQAQVDNMTRLAEKLAADDGFGPLNQPLAWTDGLKPANPYDTFLQSGQKAGEWTSQAVKAFTADHLGELEPYAKSIMQAQGFSGDLATTSHYIKEEVIQAWLDDAHAKQVAEQMVPVWKKVPTGSLPSHGHEVWKAEKLIPFTGEKTTWFVKPAAGGKVFRIEQEHGANLLGQLFGFRTAESELIKDEPAFGEPVQAQKAIAGDPLGHYTDMAAIDSYTPQQIADIAKEHLLDWVLANDDTSANNMIQTPDGHMVGIDKGRSWGDMNWQGLDRLNMNSMTLVVYSKLYEAIEKGHLSKDVADQVYTQVIQQARKMAKVSDEQVRAILEDAFAHRTKFGPDGKEGLIQEVLNRKNNLEKDFHQLWAKLYESAGFGKEKSDFGKDMPWGELGTDNPRFGMVVFNDKGEVLLREPTGHYNGSVWTFAKGGQDKGETPLQAAIREGAEETKYEFTPVAYLPGSHKGASTTSYYYLGTAKGAKFTPEKDNGETAATKWVTPEEAKQLISLSEDGPRQRDLKVLDLAVKAWGKGKYNAKPLADPHALGSPLPEVPLAKLPDAVSGDKLFAGMSEPEFTDHVAASKGHGTPAFFGGPDLKDMHVLVYRHKDSEGKEVTNGETFIKGNAYGKVIDWLTKHAGKEVSKPVEDSATTYDGTENMPGQAPPDSPDRGGLSGERETYNTIIKAARTVSRHAADGKYNAEVLKAMDSKADDLEKMITGADAALSQDKPLPPDLHEQMTNVKAMAQHNLDLIAQVRKAKTEGTTFTHGDLPRWLPPKKPAPEEELPKDQLGKLGIKLKFGSGLGVPRGDLGEDHQFKPSGTTMSSGSGKWFTMTLPTGEQIEIGNGAEHSIGIVNHGRLRFTTHDHSAQSLERIRQAMQLMGLEMRDAEESDFEKFYWRHLLAMMDDRADGHSGKQQQVWDTLKEEFAKNGLPWAYGTGNGKHQDIIDQLAKLGEANPAAETDAYRRAFAKLTSEAQVADWAHRGGFLPRLKHFDPNSPMQAGGKPDWYRFDLAQKVKGFSMPARHSGHSSSVAEVTVKNGGQFSIDALHRVAGFGESTQGTDSNGGTAYVFTRLNQTSDVHLYFTPLALARSHNYSFPGDQWGRWSDRKGSAHWSPSVWANYTGGSNETMISSAVSMLDDLELVRASTETQRQELIKWLKDRGITHIRHMPVEDRIVYGSLSAAREKVKKNWEQHPELLDPLAAGNGYTGKPPAAVPQVQAEQKAETAALDTAPAAQAAEGGWVATQEQPVPPGWGEEPYVKPGELHSHAPGAAPHTHEHAHSTGFDFASKTPVTKGGSAAEKPTPGQVPPGSWPTYTVLAKDGHLLHYVQDPQGKMWLMSQEGKVIKAADSGTLAQLKDKWGSSNVARDANSGPDSAAALLDNLIGAAGKTLWKAPGGSSLPLPQGWEAYQLGPGAGENNVKNSNVLWAKDSEGNWWKVGGIYGTEPSLMANANSASAADYQDWVTEGTIVPATKGGPGNG